MRIGQRRRFVLLCVTGLASMPLQAGEPCPQVLHGDNTLLRRAIAAMDVGTGRAALCQDIWTYETLAISVRVRRARGPMSAGERKHWLWSAIGGFYVNDSSEWEGLVMKSTFATITREPDGQTCLVNVAADGRVLREFPLALQATAVEMPCTALWDRLQLPEVPASGRKEIADLLKADNQAMFEVQSADAGTAAYPRSGKH